MTPFWFLDLLLSVQARSILVATLPPVLADIPAMTILENALDIDSILEDDNAEFDDLIDGDGQAASSPAKPNLVQACSYRARLFVLRLLVFPLRGDPLVGSPPSFRVGSSLSFRTCT